MIPIHTTKPTFRVQDLLTVFEYAKLPIDYIPAFTLFNRSGHGCFYIWDYNLFRAEHRVLKVICKPSPRIDKLQKQFGIELNENIFELYERCTFKFDPEEDFNDLYMVIFALREKGIRSTIDHEGINIYHPGFIRTTNKSTADVMFQESKLYNTPEELMKGAMTCFIDIVKKVIK